jgi:hypothetical protein
MSMRLLRKTGKLSKTQPAISSQQPHRPEANMNLVGEDLNLSGSEEPLFGGAEPPRAHPFSHSFPIKYSVAEA